MCSAEFLFQYWQNNHFQSLSRLLITKLLKEASWNAVKFTSVCWSGFEPEIHVQFKTHSYAWVKTYNSRIFWKSEANRTILRESKQLRTKRLTFTWYGFFSQEICEYQTVYFPSFFGELALSKRSYRFVTTVKKEWTNLNAAAKTVDYSLTNNFITLFSIRSN